jgi:predicted ATPase
VTLPDSRRKPPRIERLQIQNFRALRDVEFKAITPLTILLGPNGSGKSTVFDVFAFLAECFTDGLRRAVSSRGDGTLRDLRSRDSAGPIALELTYREGFAGRERPSAISYHLEIDEERGRPIVVREWMRWKRQNDGAPFRFLDYARGHGSVITGEVPEDQHIKVQRPLTGADVLAVSTLGQLAENPRVKALRDFVTGWQLSHLSAKDMRAIPTAGPQEHLSRSGDNIVNVIQFLQENHPDRLAAIFDTLRRRIPQLERVDPTMLPTGHLLLMLKDAPFSQPVQARYASDGTMKLLAYLVQLQDPNPPPLIGIEEPENFLHPKLLRELAEECDQASAQSQLLVTTHSPFFLDALTPQQVWAMTRDAKGYATAQRIAAMPGIQQQLSAGATLGQLWMENYFTAGNP